MMPETSAYTAMLATMEAILVPRDDATRLDVRLPFRSRSRHTRRVAAWAWRLLQTDGVALDEAVSDALMTSAIFHDVGYALPGEEPHAEKSACWFRAHAAEFGYEGAAAERIAFLIGQHSDKELILSPETPLELTLLMEADLLDELGAMAILWDAMAEGASAVQSYERSLERIRVHVERLVAKERFFPTPGARSIYQEKRTLTDYFTGQLARDLELWEG